MRKNTKTSTLRIFKYAICYIEVIEKYISSGKGVNEIYICFAIYVFFPHMDVIFMMALHNVHIL